MRGHDLQSVLDQQPWLFAFVYIGFWCLMSVIIGATTGWQRMARAFPADHVPTGQLFRWRTLMLGMFTHYGNCINVIVSSEGIYMAPAMLFRIGHTPLLLPWTCVVAIEPVRGLMAQSKLVLDIDGKRLSLFLPAQITGDLERLSRKKAVSLTAAQAQIQTRSLR